MKLIHKYKSPNYNERQTKKIKYLIIHYTALNSSYQSLKFLCSKKNKVSCHYLISKTGLIYNLVSEKKRAWHAGKSFWKGYVDINSSSIGIELDYLPDELGNNYPQNQIKSLIKLIQKLKLKYQIKPNNILGHSDIAPYRKIDPGINFPWLALEKRKLSFEIKKIKNIKYFILLGRWFKFNKFLSRNKRILLMLSIIGYDISLSLESAKHFNMLLRNYNNRFIGYIHEIDYNKKIYSTIETHFLNVLLTNLKK